MKEENRTILFCHYSPTLQKEKKKNMEERNVKTVNVEDFKDNSHVIYYVDDDFAIIDSLEGISYDDDSVRLDCFLIMICVEGCIQLDINYKTYQLQAGDLMLGLPNTVIGNAMLSPKNKLGFAAFSNRFLQRIIKIERETWDTAIHIYKNPVTHADEDKNEGIFQYYRNLIMAKVNDEPHSYQKQVMQHLFSALFCEMIGHIAKEIAQSDEAGQSKENIKQSDYILRKFAEMLAKDNGMHRSVSYFADALCYSPKHFSKVIKQACGHTPLELINKSAIEHIKYRLKRSDKSIKEIAEEFNFPNQSFFGKYVKAYVGMSPANYRNSEEE